MEIWSGVNKETCTQSGFVEVNGGNGHVFDLPWMTTTDLLLCYWRRTTAVTTGPCLLTYC